MSTPVIEVISPTLSVEWHDNNQLVILRIGGFSLNDTITLGKTMKQIILDWPQEKPFLFMYHGTNWNAGSVSPTVRTTTLDLFKIVKDRKLTGRTAVVFPRTLFMQAFQFFLNVVNSKDTPTKIFYDEAEALKWMRELEQDPETSSTSQSA